MTATPTLERSIDIASASRHRPLQHWVENVSVQISVADPDPDGPPGSGSISQRYGSGSFYHQAKTVRKTLIPTAL
jgi:hypothetical protein